MNPGCVSAGCAYRHPVADLYLVGYRSSGCRDVDAGCAPRAAFDGYVTVDVDLLGSREDCNAGRLLVRDPDAAEVQLFVAVLVDPDRLSYIRAFILVVIIVIIVIVVIVMIAAHSVSVKLSPGMLTETSGEDAQRTKR